MLFRKMVLTSMLVSMLGVLAIGCFDDDDENGNDVPISGESTITASKSGSSSSGYTYEYKYFSLRKGEEVDAANVASTQNWDLRFTSSRRILTNSGATAAELASDGAGGVVFTDGIDFNAAIDINSLDFNRNIATDKKFWFAGHGDSVNEKLTNLMSFPGYDTGDGIESNAYEGDTCDKSQYFIKDGMPPTYTMTNNVYVVRHADGSGYSKVQILQMEYESVTDDQGIKTTTYAFKFKYENL